MASSKPTFTELLPLKELFPQPSLDQWRSVAEASLKGRPLERLTVRTHEAIDIPPLATSEDVSIECGYPGQQPFVRGRTALGAGVGGWEVSQRIGHPDPVVAARWAAEDLERGAHSVWLIMDRATRTAEDDPDHTQGDGVRISGFSDLEPIFECVDFATTPIHLAAGGNFAAVAAVLVAAARKNGIQQRQLLGSFDCDPLGALVTDGALPMGLEGSLQMLAELAAWAREYAPELRTMTVSTLPYHVAGADMVQELAYALATAVEYLRAAVDRGIEPTTVCRQIGFRHGVGRDLFMEAAKLRATRRLWARVAEACGAAEPERAAPVHAVASPRSLTTRDPWVNGLRTTVGSFAAVVGGADIITVLPFDAAIGRSDELSRRMAVNSQTILREESHLGRVVDPGGGSWYLEKLTDDLALAAWEHFQKIEAAGGMAAALADGVIADELATSLARCEDAVATLRDPITGVSSYPNLAEHALERDQATNSATTPHRTGVDPAAELALLFNAANSPDADGSVFSLAIDAAVAGATVFQLATALRATRQSLRTTPISAHREAEAFEHLRDASDQWLEEKGSRPKIFLANMGPVADHKPRATFATGFFESGGIEVPGNAGFETTDEAVAAFGEAGTRMAVICSSDARYPKMVPELAASLEKSGARTVLVAGKPGDHETAWREAGVTGFIHIGCNRVRMLADLLQEEGVLHV